MKYILNETPIRTTNNFRMNDIKLDLDLPTSTSFKSFNGYDNIKYEYDKDGNIKILENEQERK